METPVSRSDNQKRTNAEKKDGLLKKFMRLDTKKKIQYVAILLVIVIILAIYFGSSSGQPANTPEAQPTATQENNTSSVEERLMQALSKIEGAGKVEVMITYESSAEIVPAISIDTQESTTKDNSDNGSSTTDSKNTQSEIVTISGSDGISALVLREDSPKVLGVLVIAQGADDIGVKLNLLKAVQTVLNVSPDRVDVYKMNNE